MCGDEVGTFSVRCVELLPQALPPVVLEKYVFKKNVSCETNAKAYYYAGGFPVRSKSAFQYVRTSF